MTYSVLDLFSGIGGFSLGLERTGGFNTAAFCEIDPFCRRVLAKHWPDVPCYDDIRTLTADTLARDGITVDVICGGFPCQDLSHAGKRAGLEGARSGLWREYARLIGELRPRFVIVENVPGLLSLGMGDVLGDLAAIGYDATWDCIPAAAVGAPHRRDRVWLVAANTSSHRRKISGAGDKRRDINASRQWLRDEPCGDGASNRARDVADAHGAGLQGAGNVHQAQIGAQTGQSVLNDDGHRWQWLAEPNVGRVAHGIPSRVDRLRALGNAVVPQIPELIGRAILAAGGAS